MARRVVDNLVLERWRGMDAIAVLRAVADHLKQDLTFRPVKSLHTTRWHVNAGGYNFELLVTGPKFHDTRAGLGGGGAVDLVIHLFHLNFKQAVSLLRDKGL